MASPKKIIKTGYTCPITGNNYSIQSGNFYISKSKFFVQNGGFIPYSKQALNELFQNYYNLFDDVKKAIRQVCIMCDLYYRDDLADFLNKLISPKFSDYYRKIARINKCYADTIVEEQQNKINEEVLAEIKAQEEELEKIENEIDDEVVTFFGDGFTLDEYVFLVSTYKEWKERVGASSVSEETLVKNIAYNLLEQDRFRQKRQSTDKLEASFLNLLKSGGWLPSQNQTDNQSMDAYGVLIKRIEDERPISDPDEEFKDVDSISDYISAFFTVPLAKSIGLRGVESEAYDRLMEKYSVKDEVDDLNEEEEDLLNVALGKTIDG